MIVVYKVFSNKTTAAFKKALKANGFRFLTKFVDEDDANISFIEIIVKDADLKPLLEKTLQDYYENFDFVNSYTLRWKPNW